MSYRDFSEATIRQNTTSKVLPRGEAYYESGAVRSLVRRGEIVQAEVEGSEGLPYRVTLSFRESGGMEALCSCPYDYEGGCKRLVAVALACLHEPHKVKEQPELAQILAPLTREQLLALLLQLAERDLELSDDVATQVARFSPSSESSGDASTRATTVNSLPYRRQVRALLRSVDDLSGSEAYYQVGGIVRGIDQTLDAARDFAKRRRAQRPDRRAGCRRRVLERLDLPR